MKKKWNLFDFSSDPDPEPDPFFRKLIRGSGSKCGSGTLHSINTSLLAPCFNADSGFYERIHNDT